MRLAGKVLRVMADVLDPPQLPPPRQRAFIPPKSIFDYDEKLAAQRNEDAFSLVDPDTVGYVLVRAVKDGANAEMKLGIALDDDLWSPMCETLGRIVLEAGRMAA